MKICPICGKEIINGINGCQLMNECFDCHGGYPKYAPATNRNVIDWNALDALEDRCIRDWEE